ncbi:MAG: hypothetical protein ACT4O9_09235 [Blastocatellia bacterium]
MKRALYSLIIAFTLSTFVISQEFSHSRSKKIAIVNKYAFDDPKTGIRKLSAAWSVMSSTCCFPASCTKENYTKRKTLLIDPILREISWFIIDTEVHNGFLVLDGVALEQNGNLLAFNKQLDITAPLIKHFNEQVEIALKTPFIVTVPSSNIATIDTKLFFDHTHGIKGLKGLQSDATTPTDFCGSKEQCDKIFSALQVFADSKGYNLVLDSGKPIPEKLVGFRFTNITTEFVKEYNGANK